VGAAAAATPGAERGWCTEKLGVEELLKSEAARSRIALIWKKRAVGEHQSTARFATYAERLKGFGVPQRFQDKTFEASADELRHKQVCIDMAHRLDFGEITFEPQDFTPRFPIGPENMLADMVAFCCIVETMNVAQLSTNMGQIKNTELRQATRTLLVDEVKHSRLGWAFLSWARRQGLGGELGQHLPDMFMDAVPPELFAEVPAHPDEELLLASGDPSMPIRLALFLKTANEVILPGLETNGVSTDRARAWLANPSWPHPEAGHQTT
jgi:hypothetical protein